MKLKIWVQIRKTDLQCHFKSGRGEGDWEGGSQCPPYSAKSWIRPCKIRYTVRYLKCLPEISDFYRWQFRHWSQWWEWWWQPPRPAVCTGWSSCLLRQNKTIQHPNAGPIVNYLSPWKKRSREKWMKMREHKMMIMELLLCTDTVLLLPGTCTGTFISAEGGKYDFQKSGGGRGTLEISCSYQGCRSGSRRGNFF